MEQKLPDEEEIVNKIEELCKKIFQGELGSYQEWNDIKKSIASLISTAKEEGAEEYRKQILSSNWTSLETYCDYDVYVVLAEILDKPAVLLAKSEMK